MAMIQATYANNSASVFQARFDRYLNDVLAAPMRPWEVNLALSIGGVVRALLIGAGPAGAARWPVVDVPVRQPLELVARGGAGAGALLVLRRDRRRSTPTSWDHTAFVTNIVILPLTFLGGVFYSVDRLPVAVARDQPRQPDLLPANAVRYGFLGTSDVSVVLVARGHRRARRGQVGVELMAVSDRAPAEALRTRRRASRPSLLSAGSTSLQFGAALGGDALRRHRRRRATSLLRSLFAAADPVRVWRPRCAATRARDLRLVALFGLVLGAMNLCILRGARPHPARRRGDDRVRRPAGASRSRSRAGAWTCAWVALAAVGIVLLANPFGGGGVDAVGLVFVARRRPRAGPPTSSLAQRARRGVFAAGAGLALAMVVAALVPLGPGHRRRGARPAARRSSWRIGARSRC